MPPKIALCFLTYGNLSKPEIWSKFINPNYNIYIHNKYDFDGDFKKYCIENKINTKWGNISLVNATLLLFKEAFQTNENEYFVLLSDKCIPLYGSADIYNKIIKMNNNVILNYNLNRDRYYTLYHKEFFNYNDFMKQHQWMILNRNTVKFFIDNDYTHIFGSTFDVPDEHYFINIMNKYNISYINKKITYVNWNEPSDSSKYKNYPKTYDNLTMDIVNNVLNSGCMFMRKISSTCNIPDELMLKYEDDIN